MRPTRRIRLGRMEIENLGELQSCDQLDREKKQLEADDWYIRQLPTVLVAWRINDMQILLESGFRYTLHERLDGDLAAREAYRAALPQATSDLKKLISRLGSFWEESVPDMAVAIRRFETFLSGWRTYMRESWPDGWEVETDFVVGIDQGISKDQLTQNIAAGVSTCIDAIGYMKEWHHHHTELPDRRNQFFCVLFLFPSAMFGLSSPTACPGSCSSGKSPRSAPSC